MRHSHVSQSVGQRVIKGDRRPYIYTRTVWHHSTPNPEPRMRMRAWVWGAPLAGGGGCALKPEASGLRRGRRPEARARNPHTPGGRCRFRAGAGRRGRVLLPRRGAQFRMRSCGSCQGTSVGGRSALYEWGGWRCALTEDAEYLLFCLRCDELAWK